MRRFRNPGRQLHVLFALLFILTSFASPAALAANDDAPVPVDVQVTSFTCLSDPGNVSLLADTIPPSCTPVPGVFMTVQSDLDDTAASCTTDATGACTVQVTSGSIITARQDTSLLSGTTPRMNPIITNVVDKTEVTFVNIPDAATGSELPEAPEGAEAPVDDPAESTLPEEPKQSTQRTISPSLDLASQNETTGDEGDGGTTDLNDPATSDDGTGDQKDTGEGDGTNTNVNTSESPESTSSATTTSTATETETSTVTATSTATQAPAPVETPTTTPEPSPEPVTKTYATVSGTGGAGLRCRADANTTSSVITVLAEGSKVETRGAAANGWIPVKCAGTNGWIYAGYATTSTETTTPTNPTTPPATGTTGTATVVNTGGAGLRCRASASTSGAIITVLAEGSKVETRGSVSNGWLPVKCAGTDGYIYATYASINTTAAPTPSPTPVDTTPPVSGTSGWGTVRNTGGGGLNCRASASLSGDVITILAEGSTVETRGAAVDGWVPVKCAGSDGWVSSSYFVVSTSGSLPTPTPTPTQTPSAGTGTYAMVSGTGYGGLNCRTSASTTSGVITILPEGTNVETRGSVSNGWLPVKCAGQNGWVSAAYVLIGTSSGSGTGAVWMDIDLTRQYMVVYRGSTVIGQTYVSTGRYGFDTPPGTFYTNWKLPSQTMTGVLGGEYYYVEDVPWVMYFTNRGHAIHGAYWHNNFGYRMSHGCVNLPVPFAKWLYEISPVGTRLYIHY